MKWLRQSQVSDKAIEDLNNYIVNADEDGVAYTYLYWADSDEIYAGIKSHKDETLVSLFKKFIDTAKNMKGK